MISTEIEKLYKEQVLYFERPVISNHSYDYKVIDAWSPYDFTISIDDSVTSQHEKQLKAQLDLYLERLKKTKKSEARRFKIDQKLFYVGMPVLVKHQEGEGPAPVGSLLRGMVMKIGQKVDILRVDVSGVIARYMEDILPVSVHILRIPKLGMPCRLAQIRPAGKKPSPSSWPKDRNYTEDFTGTKSQTVTFLDYYPESSMYDTVLEVDKVNVALRYFHLDVALPVAAEVLQTNCPQQSYLISDFTPWVGLKVIVYGLRVFRDENDQGKLKCVLQMHPEMVNTIQDKIAAYVGSADKKTSFKKTIGAPCLAMYGGEYFRATILREQLGRKYLVEYVDYKEQHIVSASDLMALPPDLLAYPEGASICQNTDVFSCPTFKDDAKLEQLVKNQDLYAVVNACGDPKKFSPGLLVSLFKPNFDGPDTSFMDLLGITQHVPQRHEILQRFEPISEELAQLCMTSQIPNPHEFISGSLISHISSLNSLFIQLPDNLETCASITADLTNFYYNGGCPERVLEEFMDKKVTGTYVAARQEVDNDDLLHRAKVIDENDGLLHLLYIDYGTTEWVMKEAVWPLHKYFAKDPLQAIEVAIKRERRGWTN